MPATRESLVRPGRVLLAVAMLVFGVQYFLYGRFVGGVPPVPASAPGNPPWAYLAGIALIAAGLGIAIRKTARASAMLLGMLFFLCVAFLHLPALAAHVRDPVRWTRAFEPLAICGAAWVLAGVLPSRFLSAVPPLVFGVQHFMYATFVGSLVPGWIPGHLFLAYFTGAAFIAAAISIALDVRATLAASLGAMFLLWALILHLPWVAAVPGNEDEWTGVFVALAMGGAAFIVAGNLAGTPGRRFLRRTQGERDLAVEYEGLWAGSGR